MSTLYRNRETGDVIDVSTDADLASDIKARKNWFPVTEEQSKQKLVVWEGSLDAKTVDPAEVWPPDPYTGEPGPVDVPQSAPTGTAVEPDTASIPKKAPKGLPVQPAEAPAGKPAGDPDGKQLPAGAHADDAKTTSKK